MYIGHFGFIEFLFSIMSDFCYLYMSEVYCEVFVHFFYGIGEGGGFVQFIGEVGIGKTMLCRCLFEQLFVWVDVVFIFNPKFMEVEFLVIICDEFRIFYLVGIISWKVYVDVFYYYLFDVYGCGYRIVLIIDEVQDLVLDVFE